MAYHKGRKLTKDYCRSVASQYNVRQHLLDGDSSVYRKCRLEGWLDEFLPPSRRPNFSKEFCRGVASGFNVRGDLEKGDNPVYQKCVREGWLQEFFGDTANTASDNDCIYLIKTPLKVNGNCVYKVGITSSRLEDRRVQRVISASGFNSELVILANVECKATGLEKDFLDKGAVVTFEDKFDGYTEYRAFTEEEVIYIMNTIKQNMGRV